MLFAQLTGSQTRLSRLARPLQLFGGQYRQAFRRHAISATGEATVRATKPPGHGQPRQVAVRARIKHMFAVVKRQWDLTRRAHADWPRTPSGLRGDGAGQHIPSAKAPRGNSACGSSPVSGEFSVLQCDEVQSVRHRPAGPPDGGGPALSVMPYFAVPRGLPSTIVRQDTAASGGPRMQRRSAGCGR